MAATSAVLPGRTTKTGGCPRLSASAPYCARAASSVRTKSGPTIAMRGSDLFSTETASWGPGLGRTGPPRDLAPNRPDLWKTDLTLPYKPNQPRDALAQTIEGCRVREADEAGRVEGFAGGRDDVFALEERVGEVERRAPPVGREKVADVRKQVERALRHRAPQARLLAQPRDHLIAPALILRQHVRHALLRSRQRRDRGLLRDRVHVRRGVTLERVGGLNHRLGPNHPAAPPAGHRVGLRRGSAEDDAIAHRLAENRGQIVRHRVVDQP